MVIWGGVEMISDLNSNAFIPIDWKQFETISLEALKIIHSNPNFIKNDRPGQKQHGVDIYLQNNDEMYIMDCYPCIDLHALSEIAKKRRQDVQNYIKSLD